MIGLERQTVKLEFDYRGAQMLYDYTEMQFTDELLGKEVLPQHVERAEQGLYAFAKRLGVHKEM